MSRDASDQTAYSEQKSGETLLKNGTPYPQLNPAYIYLLLNAVLTKTYLNNFTDVSRFKEERVPSSCPSAFFRNIADGPSLPFGNIVKPQNANYIYANKKAFPAYRTNFLYPPKIISHDNIYFLQSR
jgi:hypothetical protein